MSYSTGMMNKRVTVARRAANAPDRFGKSGQVRYEILGTYWAAYSFNKGMKSLQEGAFDAYDTVMFRMRYHEGIDRWCILQYKGRWYQIQTLNVDYMENQIQITALEMTNQNVTIVQPYSSGYLGASSPADI